MAAFQLTFKTQVDSALGTELTTSSIFGVGNNWITPWRRYLECLDSVTNSFYFFNGVGGFVGVINTPGMVEYRSQLTCSLNSNNVPVVQYPSGAMDEFGLLASDGASLRYFLTRAWDPNGNAFTFQYNTNYAGGAGAVVCVTNILDVDGRTNHLTYTNIGSYTLISEVDMANGSKVNLYYDTSTYPNLTKIVDAMGMTSSINYSSFTFSPSVGNTLLVTTPYGTDVFSLATDNTSGSSSIWVQEQGQRNQLFVYIGDGSSFPIGNSYLAWCPTTTGFTNTFDTNNINQRNTFYWNPVQFQLLPAIFSNNLASGILSLTNLVSTNFLQARQQHWLCAGGGTSLGQTLSLDRAPSPDGTTQGEITWYDYPGKAANSPQCEGTSHLPCFVAWTLPGNQSRFFHYQRNVLGYPTNVVETWNSSSGSTVQQRTTTFTYNATNNVDLIAATNAARFQVQSNVFNTFHQVTYSYDALNQVTTNLYDSNHRLISVSRPTGLTTTNIYGTNGFLSQTVDVQINRTNAYTWTNGMVCTHTDERGLTVTNTWDFFGRLLSVACPAGTNVAYISNVYTNLDLIRTIDRMGYTKRTIYNTFRQPIQRIDENGHSTTNTYCLFCGRLDSITDPLDNTTYFTYDLSGNLILTTYADSFIVYNSYDLMGRLTNVWKTGGYSFTNLYNNQGLLVVASNNVGQVEAIMYDVIDRITNHVDANGVLVGTAYDSLNRPTSRAYPDSGHEWFNYSACGLVGYTNQLTNTTLFSYDAACRKLTETNANLEGIHFNFDPSGNLTNLVDGKAQNTWWKYDLFGRVTNKIDNLGNNLFAYGYDFDDRLTSRVNATGTNATYRYDAGGNLTNVIYSHNTSLVFQYDAVNRLTNMVDAMGATVYAYDAVGQCLTEGGPWPNDAVNYTYVNRLRNGLGLAQSGSGAWSQSYVYDAARRLTNTASRAGSFSYSYSSGSQSLVSGVGLPGGAYITNNYDNVARLTLSDLMNSAGAALSVHTYGYNLGGQRTNQTRLTTNYVNYGYDPVGQLKTAYGYESSGSARWNERFTYSYDASANLSQVSKGTVDQFNVNSLNELTTVSHSTTGTVAGTTMSVATNVSLSINGSAVAGTVRYMDATWANTNATFLSGTNVFTAVAQDSLGRSATNSSTAYLPASVSYAYDLNGNLLGDGTRVFAYDDENQLASVWVTNVWRSDFAYDGKMRRRARVEYVWRNGSWQTNASVRYLYDGNLVVQERDANNMPQVTYTRGKDLSGSFQGAGGIGGLLARTDHALLASDPPAAHAYYHCDGNGNVTCLINTNQVVVARYLYDPFGSLLSKSGSLADANAYRFSSKEFHANSGLVYYLYRFYDPGLQRWPNRDPIGEDGGINLYGMVANDPINTCDGNGLFSLGEWGGIIGAGLIGAGQGLAAAGDGALPIGHPLGSLGLYDPNDPTLQMSQMGGAVASMCLAGGGGLKAGGIGTRIARHGPHHSFPPFGKLPHLQLNWWQNGVKGSGGTLPRIPFPRGTPGFPK